MNKKRQLLLSIAVISLTLILVPVSIWAANFLSIGISNKIMFIVEDIEGIFSYQILGNSDSSKNVEYSPGNVFTANYVDNEDRYVLKNDENEEILDEIVLDKPESGLEFDLENKIITYTFVFINLGQNDVKITVSSDERSENNLRANNVETQYKYQIFYSDIETISQLPILNEDSINPSAKAFETTVSKRTNDIFQYIVFSYEMKLLDSQSEYFKTSFQININLSSQTDWYTFITIKSIKIVV